MTFVVNAMGVDILKPEVAHFCNCHIRTALEGEFGQVIQHMRNQAAKRMRNSSSFEQQVRINRSFSTPSHPGSCYVQCKSDATHDVTALEISLHRLDNAQKNMLTHVVLCARSG
eukprot:SAG11_NODE_3088_length_2703_cov_1.540707_5_plen_114_part_00